MTRILTAWGAIISLPVVYVVAKYIRPPRTAVEAAEPVTVGSVRDFNVDTVHMVRIGKQSLVVRKTGNGQFKSFSSKCTHLGCLVEYRKELQGFRCNCHGSMFDLDGNNLSGPAPRPLEPYRVEVRGEDIIVTLTS